jgi:diketogulonate reductase-like aldo/keto reductase
VGVIVNKPFESGGLFPAINNVSLPGWSKEWGIESWSAFFLKYIISNTNITCTIPATSQVSHLKENMAACFNPCLTMQREKRWLIISSIMPGKLRRLQNDSDRR